MIYGKTTISISNDIYQHFSTLLGKKECTKIALIIMKYFKDRFPGIINLMKLVSNVGWLSSALDKPVFYSLPCFTTVQDYMVSKPINVWIYDNNKKKRQVTLRIPTDKRDRRKTSISTFANFIHQMDAGLALFMIINMCELKAPVYTVHDNFITNAINANQIPIKYIECYTLRPPLEVINMYVNRNLRDGWCCPYSLSDPLPYDYLKEVLYNRIPNNISKKDRKILTNRIESILDNYYYYVNTVFNYNNNEKMDPNCTKLAEYFQNELKYNCYNNLNYSLHL